MKYKNLYKIKPSHNKFGFSLLELSLAIIIIALLLLAVTKGSQVLTKARITAAQALTKSSPVNGISNLVVWYETTMNESFKESELNSELGIINTWYNISPSSKTNNASAPNTDQAPILTKNSINNLPALFFDGANSTAANRDMFTFDGTPLANSDYTVVFVEKRNSSLPLKYVISGNQVVTSEITTLDNRILSLGYKTNLQIHFSQSSNNYVYPVPAYSASSQISRIHFFRFSTYVGKNYSLNGQDPGRVNDGSPNENQGLLSFNNAQIGRNLTSGYYAGYIGEIIIFNKYLTNDEKRDVEQYLSKKWKITLL